MPDRAAEVSQFTAMLFDMADTDTPRPRTQTDVLPCPCHGKTEAELARPYALFAFSLPVLALVALLIVALTA
jgi:hypothetical protein